MAKKTQAQRAIAQFRDWGEGDLREMQTLIQALIEAQQQPEPEPDPDFKTTGGEASTGKRRANGHKELKMINGCGPYEYLRYWDNGKLRSVYMGKVKEAT